MVRGIWVDRDPFQHNSPLFAELFDNFLQQDAHEFFNYLLNAISETLGGLRRLGILMNCGI